eukprot:GEMP01015100.1.p1 GENE.GEMP01015100.1~~GEMP01015100.1.p1  ORF type:complete len:493 (+),score=105.77 GEMP01015100.1:54-1532(+)
MIRVEPLGAAREVGRSCIIVTFQDPGKTTRVLLDCGAHIGFRDERRWPDFAGKGWATPRALNENIDLVLLTHFHLDHCGALPYLTERLGYRGPILMSYPTMTLCPLILGDFWAKGKNCYTREDVKRCFQKATPIGMNQRIQIGELYITAYYAGHVLGACMFLLEYRGRSVLYTGDFNMSPDRLLGSAKVPPIGPIDVVITEGTYCTTIRDSKRAREQKLLDRVRQTLEKGGKVLIPTFAVGRAQELAMLCEQYWQKHDLHYPLLCSRGMSRQAFQYYRLFAQWAHPLLQEDPSMFEFPHVSAYDMDAAVLDNIEQPQVLFAGQQMLDFGLSRRVFAQWAPDPRNLVIFPGYCPKGTLGNQVLGGFKEVDIDGKKIPINCEVQYYSLAAHADSKGIRQLLLQLRPRNVVLVHGSADRMEQFKNVLEKTLENVNVFVPAVNEEIPIRPQNAMAVDIATQFSLGLFAKARLLAPEPPHWFPRLVPSPEADTVPVT